VTQKMKMDTQKTAEPDGAGATARARTAKVSLPRGEKPEGRAQMSGGATHRSSGLSAMAKGPEARREKTLSKAEAARAAILAAAKSCLLEVGYANLSTRKVAEAAGAPLSQIHYHFGSKSGMVLALLKAENDRLLDRQRIMYAEDRPLSARWNKAVEFLEEDMASGYVRLLHEMMAASWSEPELMEDMRNLLRDWQTLLTGVAEEAETLVGGYGPFSPTEIVTLVGAIFIGGETFLLMGLDAHRTAVWPALEKIGQLIEAYETKAQR
jgi:AcrR family transcriptional regulator